MSRSPNVAADALRLWLSLTVWAYSGEGIGLPLPTKPLGLMVLARLWLEDAQTLSYSDLRAALRVDQDTSLSNAIDLLEARGFVKKLKPPSSDGRERGASLTQAGRDVIGKLIQLQFPDLK